MCAEPLKFDHEPYGSAEHSLISMVRHLVGGEGIWHVLYT
jgi:hypothetical protein